MAKRKSRPDAAPAANDNAVDAYLDESCDLDDTTHEVPYKDIFHSKSCPWFMKGVTDLQKANISYPKTSHAVNRTLADIHSFSLDTDNGSKPAVQPFEMVQYESAGLWADEQGEPCLVVNGVFDDGEEGMYLLYHYNLVKGPASVQEECQWCLKPDITQRKKRK